MLKTNKQLKTTKQKQKQIKTKQNKREKLIKKKPPTKQSKNTQGNWRSMYCLPSSKCIILIIH
jgi:hypothetical protein